MSNQDKDSRPPFARESKLAGAMLKRMNIYVDKHGLSEKTLYEVSEVLKLLIRELDGKVKLHNYRQKK